MQHKSHAHKHADKYMGQHRTWHQTKTAAELRERDVTFRGILDICNTGFRILLFYLHTRGLLAHESGSFSLFDPLHRLMQPVRRREPIWIPQTIVVICFNMIPGSCQGPARVITLADGEGIAFGSVYLSVFVRAGLSFYSASACQIETKFSPWMQRLMYNVLIIIMTRCGGHIGKTEKLWTSVSLKPHQGKIETWHIASTPYGESVTFNDVIGALVMML